MLLRQAVAVEHIDLQQVAVGVAVVLGRTRQARDLEFENVRAAVRIDDRRQRFCAGGVVVVGRDGSVAPDHLGIIQRAVGMGAGDVDDLAGRIQMLIHRGVALAGDVVTPIVLGVVGVEDIGRRLHAVGVDGRGIVTVCFLHDFAVRTPDAS